MPRVLVLIVVVQMGVPPQVERMLMVVVPLERLDNLYKFSVSALTLTEVAPPVLGRKKVCPILLSLLIS